MTTYNLTVGSTLALSESKTANLELNVQGSNSLAFESGVVFLANPIRVNTASRFIQSGTLKLIRGGDVESILGLVASRVAPFFGGGGGSGGGLDLSCVQWSEYRGSLDLIPMKSAKTCTTNGAYSSGTAISLTGLAYQPQIGDYLYLSSVYRRIESASTLSGTVSNLVLESALPGSIGSGTAAIVYECLQVDTVSLGNTLVSSMAMSSNERLDSQLMLYGGNRQLFEKVTGTCRIYTREKYSKAKDILSRFFGTSFLLRGVITGPLGNFIQFVFTSPSVEITNIPASSGDVYDFPIEFLKKSTLT